MDMMADIQSGVDKRNQPIRRVGITRLKRPLAVLSAEGVQNTVAEFSMFVSLGGDRRGAHMSRFVILLEEFREPLGHASLGELLETTRTRLDSEEAEIVASFPFFRRKLAPVSGVASLLDYRVTLRGELDGRGYRHELAVTAPVTSLCPCSKHISDYGAHNQRSLVTVTTECGPSVTPETLIDIIEANASCQVYGALKRPDEKLVTEAAYDNPKFVEDIVRDVAAGLKTVDGVIGFSVSSENIESIHNHSAFASIRHP